MGPTTEKRNLRLGDNAVEVREARTQKQLCQAGVGAGRLLESHKNLFKSVRHADADHATGADTAWDELTCSQQSTSIKCFFRGINSLTQFTLGTGISEGPQRTCPVWGC